MCFASCLSDVQTVYGIALLHPSVCPSVRPCIHPASVHLYMHALQESATGPTITNVQLLYWILWVKFLCRNHNLWLELLGNCCATPFGFPAILFADSRKKFRRDYFQCRSVHKSLLRYHDVHWFSPFKLESFGGIQCRIYWQDLCIGSHRNTWNTGYRWLVDFTQS